MRLQLKDDNSMWQEKIEHPSQMYGEPCHRGPQVKAALEAVVVPAETHGMHLHSESQQHQLTEKCQNSFIIAKVIYELKSGRENYIIVFFLSQKLLPTNPHHSIP